MATVEQSEASLRELAKRMREHAGSGEHNSLERLLSCTLRDLHVTFVGRLRDGQLTDIRQGDASEAQIRLDMTSDDLVSMVDGQLNLASAWATGRVKVQAGVRDMLRLRSMF